MAHAAVTTGARIRSCASNRSLSYPTFETLDNLPPPSNANPDLPCAYEERCEARLTRAQ